MPRLNNVYPHVINFLLYVNYVHCCNPYMERCTCYVPVISTVVHTPFLGVLLHWVNKKSKKK